MTDSQVAVVAFEGFEELDAIGPYEVFELAAARGADWTVDLLATEPTDRVEAANGLRIEPAGTLADADPDYVLVPGGGWNDRDGAGAWAEAQAGDLPAALADLHDDGATLAAVCTGGILLAEAGLLDGRPAVTHRGALDDLRATDADVVDARVVDDGDVLTCGGVTAGLDLALWLVEREFGREVAFEVETEMEYERSTDVYRG